MLCFFPCIREFFLKKPLRKLIANSPAKGSAFEHFGFQAAVETFVFAVGLRVQRTAAAGADAQSDKPCGQAGQSALCAVAPGAPLSVLILSGSPYCLNASVNAACTPSLCSFARARRMRLQRLMTFNILAFFTS